MLCKLLAGLALLGTTYAIKNVQDDMEAMDGTIGYLPINDGWFKFPFGGNGSTTSLGFDLHCPAVMNITDLFCSGDQFAIYDNGVFLGNTSIPVFNNCTSYSDNPCFTQSNSNWSSGSFDLGPGWHNITIEVLLSPFSNGTGAIRVDTYREHHHRHHDHEHHQHRHERKPPCPCSLDVCPIHTDDLIVVRTEVPRCQADNVCRSLGMHLANIDINNFMDATTLAFKCSGANSQSWINDWNGDKYQGTCLVLSTGSAAPGGAINVPSCCSARFPVVCQKTKPRHPVVRYDCNKCQSSCYCERVKKCEGLDCRQEHQCHSCRFGECHECKKCGILRH